MVYKSSFNNSYEIIGLGDLDKYNERINQYNDKVWNQTIISDVIKINNKSLSIKTIDKIYVSIKISSTKIIDTVKSNNHNLFGTQLTGKMLLVNAELCENIIYTSDSICQSVNNFKFKRSFSTYIIINENSDKNRDQYCIYPCIEFVSAILLDKRKISNSVYVFLFANKSEKECSIIDIIEEIKINIILNDENNEQMIKIELDTKNFKLNISATAKKAPRKYLADAYFDFRLLKYIESYDYIGSSIMGNEDGTKFKNELNNKGFNIGNVIELNYKEKDKIIINNFPNKGDKYNPKQNSEYFKITSKGLEKFNSTLINNIIKFKNFNNSEIGKIFFDVSNKKLEIKSTTDKIDLNYSKEQYFSVEVFNDKFCFVQEFISINGDEDLEKLKRTLNNENLDYDYALLFKHIENPKIDISNYPNDGEIYLLKGKEENFKITLDGLKTYPKILGNFMYFEHNGLLASIGFNKETKKLIVKSTGIIATKLNPTNIICKVQVYTDNNLVQSADLEFNKNADEFAQKLNNKKFDYYKSYIKITYYEILDVLKIYNYINNSGQQTEINLPNFQSMKLMITPFGLIPNGLENIIIVNNNNNQELIKIAFNIEEKKIFIASTNNVSDITLANEYYFILDLKDSTGKRKFIKEIKGLENGIELQKNFLNQSFEINDFLSLVCSKDKKIVITNYPDSSTSIYIPLYKKINFRIKINKLEMFNLFDNNIILNDENNDEMIKIEFDIKTFNLKVFSTDKKAPRKYLADKYFDFKLLKDVETYDYIGTNIMGSEDGTKFKNELNNKDFTLNDLIELNYKENDKVIIENFPVSNNKYNPRLNAEYFKITLNGFEIFDSNLIDNTIIFKNFNNLKIGEISFNIYEKRFKITSVLEEIDLNYSEEQYFLLEIFNHKFGFVQQFISVKGNENLKNLEKILNNEALDYNYTLLFKYIKNPKIEVINYPDKGNVYIPLGEEKNFKITLDGLKTYPKMLNNFMYFEHNELLATIAFNKETNKFIVKSTGNIINKQTHSNPICKVDVYRNNILTIEATLEFNKNSDEFINKLNEISFEYYKTEVQITYYETSNVLKIYNYKNINGQQTEINIPDFQSKKFMLTPFGLVPHGLQTLIIVNNNNNQEMLNIIFDTNINNKSIFIKATENVSNLNLGNIEYFSLQLKDSNNIRKKFVKINGNENALNFQNDLMNTNFEFGDSITLKYNDNSKIKITNFPNVNFQIYTPKNNQESFIITSNGLISQ